MRTLLIGFSLLMAAFNSYANDEQQKIDFIQQQFDQTKEHSQMWQWGWFGFLGTAATVQGLGASVVDDNKLRYDMSVGAITSFLGAADMLLNPMKTHNYSDQLQNISNDNPMEQSNKLLLAESW